jgi:hypothetical protein
MWLLWEENGTTVVAAGGFNGTYVDAVGEGYYLEGPSDTQPSHRFEGGYVSIPDNATLRPAAMTIGVWFFSDATGNTIPLFSNRGSNRGLTLQYDATNRRVQCLYGTGAGYTTYSGTSLAVPRNQWVYLGVGISTTAIEMFVNGATSGSSAITWSQSASNTLYINRDAVAGTVGNPAKYSVVEMHNAKLSAANMATRYATMAASNYTNTFSDLVASGSTWFDLNDDVYSLIVASTGFANGGSGTLNAKYRNARV